MCGIAGIINFKKGTPVAETILQRMCDAIYHRGPDEGGTWLHHNIGIGMRRLQIIDLVSGSQPMHNEDKTIRIVFNGEIYNFKELRSTLLARNHTFTTKSDTETILHLYEEHGEGCVNYLRGMFAFAIYDSNKEALFLARDRLGIKPLFYTSTDKSLFFGSEIKCLLEHPDMEPSIYAPALVTYFAYGYVPDPDCLFANVKKLPPGHTLTCKQGQISINQYWDVDFNHTRVHDEQYYIEKILDNLDEAVRLRLVSDVPLGAFLSGGIDSSMVVATKALHIVHKSHANVRLVVVGNHNPGDSVGVFQITRELGLEGVVYFAGQQTAVKPWLNSFDICLLCSESEGFSNTIIEYMQAGRPVICSRVGGNPEIVKHGVNGLLFEKGNINELASCIERLTADPEERNRMGKAGAAAVRDRFSVQRMAREHVKLYESLV